MAENQFNSIFDEADTSKLDDISKKMKDAAVVTDLWGNAIGRSKMTLQQHAAAMAASDLAKKLSIKLEQEGLTNTKQKIQFLREQLAVEKEEAAKIGTLTKEKADAINRMENALRSLKIEDVGKRFEETMKKINTGMSGTLGAAGSEVGAAVTAPLNTIKHMAGALTTVVAMGARAVEGQAIAAREIASAAVNAGGPAGVLAMGAMRKYSMEAALANKTAQIAEGAGKLVGSVIDGLAGPLGQLVEVAIKLRNYSWQISDASREADRGFGGTGDESISRRVMNAFRKDVTSGLSRLDEAKIVSSMSGSSFGGNFKVTQKDALSNMEVMKRTMGMSDYGFFGYISRMAGTASNEVMDRTFQVFQTLRGTAKDAGMSLKDLTKTFVETVQSGKKYLVTETENASVIKKFLSYKNEFAKQGVDIVADMGKLITNLQNFGEKLSAGEQAYFGMQAFGGSDPFEGMLKWRYGAGAEAQYVGGTNQIAIPGAGETGDMLESRVRALTGMASQIQTGSASSDLYARTQFFRSKGLDQGPAELLAQKMDSVFEKENSKTLNEIKLGSMSSKEQMGNLIQSQEKHAKIQEGLLGLQLQIMTIMMKFAQIGALHAVKQLEDVSGMNFGAGAGLAQLQADNQGGSNLIPNLFAAYGKMLQATGLQNIMKTTFTPIIKVATGQGDTSEPKPKHFGGYIQKYHEGGMFPGFSASALVKENEAMFIGKIGASVVPEKNINILTNDKMAALIEGTKTGIMSTALGEMASASAGATPGASVLDVNVNISGNVFGMSDFKKIIRDTVLEVIGGR